MLQLSHRRHEQGQTLILVAVSMMAFLAMAALAIDLVSLYVAHGEAQRAADAAALAGAKVFVASGFTSGQLGSPSSATVQASACNGSSGLADFQAKAEANQNTVAGSAPTSVSTSCSFSQPGNPQITVTVQSTGLPTFFARIWGSRSATVSATATAEAYNPSGQSVPIRVSSVKPWLVPNCDVTNAAPANPNCSGTAYFADPGTSYQIANNGSFLGQVLDLHEINPGTNPAPTKTGSTNKYSYFAIDLAPQAAVCPSASAAWGTCLAPISVGSGNSYFDNIACSGGAQLSCGDTVNIDSNSGTAPSPATAVQATQCLIHASGNGPAKGQDTFNTLPGPGLPTTIDGGGNNPDPLLQTAENISRSDSVITVPLWDGNDPCPAGACNPVTITGFMQLGIMQTKTAGGIEIDAAILNVSGCGSASGGTPVGGGGLSPIPVRLIHP